MTFILDGLFLGTVDDACNGQRLKQKGITHILTVNAKPLSKEIIGNFSYLFVHALDMYGTDLLGRFEECIQFIEDGRKSGGVLIHCYFGISRSSTLVIAYLMYKLSLTLEEATECVTKLRPQIKPNQGFLEQLGLFEAMGNRIDRTYEAYKQYRLNNLAIKMQQAQVEHLEEDHFSADPFHATNQGVEAVYKCRKCRRPLFRQNAVMSHTVGKGDAAFDWRATQTPLEKQGVACLDSVFVEPIKWMSGAILEIEGKLSCPKCFAKIGSYNWAGKQCHCGSWVTPAFHIQNSKVDKCASRNPATIGQINPRVPAPHVKEQVVEVPGKSQNQGSNTETVIQTPHAEDPTHKNVYTITQDTDTKRCAENSTIDINTEKVSNISLSNEEFRHMENVMEEQAL